jgi:hypothetical protein
MDALGKVGSPLVMLHGNYLRIFIESWRISKGEACLNAPEALEASGKALNFDRKRGEIVVTFMTWLTIILNYRKVSEPENENRLDMM